jgi:hypothetical protein
MNIKTTAVAIILALGFPLAAQAQETKNYENSYESLKVSCQSGVECNDFNVNFQEQGEQIAQTRRTRTRRTRDSSSLDSKYYAGGNVGLFLPFFGDDADDADLGFGFGGLFGYKFNQNISAELEIYDALGGTETDDLGYNLFGVAANGVYRYYFNPDDSKSLYAFGGLGLGFGVVSQTGDVADDLDDDGVDTSRTGFLLQTKAGVGYPLSDNLDLFGQARYANVFIGEEDDIEGSGDDGNGLSFDVGATYNF